MPQPITQDEYDDVFRIMVDTWPTLRRFQRTRTDSRATWFRDLRSYTRDELVHGIHHLRRTFKGKEPSLAHLLDAINERRTDNGPVGKQRTSCGHCEHGWIIIDRTGQWTVKQCPNGCTPGKAA